MKNNYTVLLLSFSIFWSSNVTSITSVDSVIIPFFENNRTISKISFFLKISIANNSKVKSELDWSIFLDLELSINSNFTTLLISLSSVSYTHLTLPTIYSV